MTDEINDLVISGNESSERSKGFTESTGYQVNLIGEPEIIRGAAASVSDNAETVRIVDHYACVIFFCESNYLGQLTDIAAHAEHAIAYDQFTAFNRNTFQCGFKMIHIRMIETDSLCIA